jgi:hypothetical protein
MVKVRVIDWKAMMESATGRPYEPPKPKSVPQKYVTPKDPNY